MQSSVGRCLRMAAGMFMASRAARNDARHLRGLQRLRGSPGTRRARSAPQRPGHARAISSPAGANARRPAHCGCSPVSSVPSSCREDDSCRDERQRKTAENGEKLRVLPSRFRKGMRWKTPFLTSGSGFEHAMSLKSQFARRHGIIGQHSDIAIPSTHGGRSLSGRVRRSRRRRR